MAIQLQPPRDDERESLEQVGFNQVEGVIKDLAYLGSVTTYHVQLDSGMVVKVTQTNAARHDASHLTWGDRVHVWWCGSDVVVLTQ
jgi:putrescine transport system ATP-binding protein